MSTDSEGIDVYVCIHCGALVAHFYLERHLAGGHNYRLERGQAYENNFRFAFRMDNVRLAK